jgi:hypothetical protein
MHYNCLKGWSCPKTEAISDDSDDSDDRLHSIDHVADNSFMTYCMCEFDGGAAVGVRHSMSPLDVTDLCHIGTSDVSSSFDC